MELFGIEVSFEEWNSLMTEQEKGKELVVEDGKVIARDRVITQKELNQNKINQLDNWFKTDYAKYEQMFNRRHFFAIDDVIVDEFRGKTYHNLGELYREGEDVAKEIRELRESLKTDTNQLTNNNQSVIMEVEN